MEKFQDVLGGGRTLSAQVLRQGLKCPSSPGRVASFPKHRFLAWGCSLPDLKGRMRPGLSRVDPNRFEAVVCKCFARGRPVFPLVFSGSALGPAHPWVTSRKRAPRRRTGRAFRQCLEPGSESLANDSRPPDCDLRTRAGDPASDVGVGPTLDLRGRPSGTCTAPVP